MSSERVPPTQFWSVVQQLGPGMIVTGSIVGSGELIATTTLGAKVGFAALWLIVVSCLIKVAVQIQLGRYTIATGQTTFQALDHVPGPRWRVSWAVWAWMIMFIGVTFQTGGMIGGVGQVFHLIFPPVPVPVWAVAIAGLTAWALSRGRYPLIEKSCTAMVASFTLITIGCAIALAWTPYAIRPEHIIGGLQFRIPEGGLAVAFAVFGITGVGATELIYYPYWCLEKGYARFVGPKDASAAWLDRARGWIRVMQVDALVAMVVYTVATVAFYLLGAAVLFGMGVVPSGYDMVKTLSNMYTTTLGTQAYFLFLLGAFFVLYSTIFASTASNSRVVVDFLEISHFLSIQDDEARWRWRRTAVVFLLSLFTLWYLIVGEPVKMVIIGGLAQACMLPVIGFSTLYLRYRHTQSELRPHFLLDLLLWLCSTLMLAFAIFTVISKLRS